jgi:hypothetical protein
MPKKKTTAYRDFEGLLRQLHACTKRTDELLDEMDIVAEKLTHEEHEDLRELSEKLQIE